MKNRWRFAWAWIIGCVLGALPVAALRPIVTVPAGGTVIVDGRGEAAGSITVFTSEGARATNTLNFTGACADAQAVVLAGKTYTYENAALDADGEIALGDGVAATCRDNLLAGITLGAGSGTLYAAAMTANANATAEVGGAALLLATALVGGTDGNALTSTETLGNGVWIGGGVLAGGTDVVATVGYVIDEVLGTTNPGFPDTTVTDTSGGKATLITDWPIIKVTSSAAGPTYVIAW